MNLSTANWILPLEMWSRWIKSSSVLCLVTLCDPVDCSLPGSSVHGISQAGILEWVAMPSSRGYSQPRDRTIIAGRLFTIWTTREAPLSFCLVLNIRSHFSYIVAFPAALSTSAVPEDMNHPAVSSGRSMNCELKQWRWVWCIVTCHFQHFKPRGRMSCRSGWGRIHWQPRALWSMWHPVSLQNQILSSREQGFYLPFSAL